MREIEFRGKTPEGKWIYGGISITNDRAWIDQGFIGREWFGDTFVDKDTIGQYTGIKDENDIEIYEGDIIKFSYDAFIGNFDTFTAKGIVVFEDGAFFVNCLENERNIKDEQFLLYEINIDAIEIIGNIWDNPELLKEN